MSDDQSPGRRFTLDQANQLLPEVRRVTDEAVRQVEALAAEMLRVGPESGRHAELDEALNATIAGWAREIEALGLEAKGLWLVDFDTGDGYYCWRHPEPAVSHYHGYAEGFAGRMKIV